MSTRGASRRRRRAHSMVAIASACLVNAETGDSTQLVPVFLCRPSHAVGDGAQRRLCALPHLLGGGVDRRLFNFGGITFEGSREAFVDGTDGTVLRRLGD